jgi:hypothetical protein
VGEGVELGQSVTAAMDLLVTEVPEVAAVRRSSLGDLRNEHM